MAFDRNNGRVTGGLAQGLGIHMVIMLAGRRWWWRWWALRLSDKVTIVTRRSFMRRRWLRIRRRNGRRLFGI